MKTISDLSQTTDAERNGSELSNRVRSLRLGNRVAAGQGKSRAGWIPWVLCAGLLVTTAAFGYRAYRITPAVPVAQEESVSPKDRPTPTPTNVGAVASSGDVALESKGYVVPLHQIQVGPNKVSGILKWVNPKLEEGARFNKGDKLAEIQDFDYRADFEQAEATLREAERRLAELESTMPLEIEQKEFNITMMTARKDLTEYRAKTNTRAGTALSELERRETTLQLPQDRANLDMARKELELVKRMREEQIKQAVARVKHAQAAYDRARQLLENCTITSPINGTILKKNAEEGNNVNPSAFSNGIAASLCEIADLSELEIDLSIQERDIARVQVGQPCTVMPEAFQNYPPFKEKYPNGYPAKVGRIMPYADRAKGAISVRVRPEVPQEEAGVYLKPEMGVIVSFKKQ